MKLALSFLLALAMVLAGPACAAPPPAATASPGELLAAAFPEWHPTQTATPGWPHKPGKPWVPTIRKIRLPNLAWPWLPRAGEDAHTTTVDTHTVQITPLAVVPIDDVHVALVTVAEPVGGDCHYGCIYEVGIYFFSKDVGGWRLGRRIDLAREMDGELPDKPAVRAWPGHGMLLSMERDRCYQDACAGDLDLFGFEADKLLYVFETSISVDSRLSEFKSSDGAAHDCQEILSTSFKPVEDVTFDDVHCHQARGTWRIDGDGIAFTFREAARSVDESGQLGRLSRSVTHARVELRGEGLKPVAGALPGYGI